MSDFDLDCGDCDCCPDCDDCDCCPDCDDCDCCPDCVCLECNCCYGDCDCCDFSFCCFWEIDDSPRSNRKSERSHCRGGCRAIAPPTHRIVKEEPEPKPKPKPKKISWLKKIFMFGKSKEKDQEQKPAEKQLDGMGAQIDVQIRNI